MSIPVQAVVTFIDEAFDGMLAIADGLGDGLVNQRPNLPGANSPFAILAHCCGVAEHWIGEVLAVRTITRDRDAEFHARGTVADLRQALREQLSRIQQDVGGVVWERSLGHPIDLHGTLQEHTQGDVLLHCYRELAQHRGHLEITRDLLLTGRSAIRTTPSGAQ